MTKKPLYLDIQHDRVDKIFHIADIHFRNVKRHDEYREVLQQFFDDIKKFGTDNSIIIIAGDIAHSKVETSPELFREMTWLFSECTKLTDTIVIPGNHDCNLSNKQRLDVISPVVKSLKDKRLHYLRENGLFRCKNILFSHYGIFADPEDYVKHDDIPTIYKNQVDTTIALFHGPMDSAKTDIGYEVSNKAITKKLFNGFDISIFGDIHMYQCLQKYDKQNDLPEIVYSGSPIQQNHGEDLSGHGYVIWDVKNRKHKHIELKNEYGFFTADIKNGKLQTDLTKMPAKARLRMRCYETEPTEVKAALLEIRKLSDLQEVSYIRGESMRNVKRGNVSKVPLQRLTDPNFQNELIETFLRSKYPRVTKKILERIFELNKLTNSKLSSDDKTSPIRWIPKRLEFDNMFSYGEGNVIDFTKFSGINGLFASNASGKSSLVDAMCFILFDKCSKSFKAANVMNDQKMSFKGKMVFDIDGVEYTVKRSAKRDKKGNVRVEVDFFKMVDGEKKSLNDESRRHTNDVIRSVIGSFEDFVLTTASLQKKPQNFADKGQTERKDIIAKFLGITTFDKLSSIASDDSKQTLGALKKFDKKDFTQKIAELEDLIDDREEKYKLMLQTRDVLNSDKETNLEKIVKLNSQITNLTDVPDNVEDIEKELQSKKDTLKEIHIDELKQECSGFIDANSEIKKQIKKFEDDKISKKKEIFDDWKKRYSELEHDIALLRVDVNNKYEKVQNLNKHEYDPNCEFCMKNAFVQDALKAKKELDEMKPIVTEKVREKNDLNEKIAENGCILDDYEEYLELKSAVLRNESEWHKCINKVQEKEKEVIRLQNEIETLERRIKRYYDSLDIVEKNDEIRQQIVDVDKKNKYISQKLDVANEKIMEVHSQIEVWKSEMKGFNDKIKEAENLEETARAYELYLQAINRDGVPYDIICKSIPALETEVNEILSQIVEFGISIEMDGKNINANIVYDDRSWPIEMTSGMESFVSNLALRIGLTNISNMPHTNFLVVDEGFGSLDHDTMSSLNALFTYLKTNFDFILIVSHIDTLRDLVDGQIEIKKEKGFSKVNHV